MRVLIVEDEWIIVKMMERALVADGIEVVAKANSVEQALALIQSTAIDAALLDPRLDGVWAQPVAEALQAKGVPFLVISGSAVPDGSGAMSAAPFLFKPFELDELVQCTLALAGG